MIQILHYPKDPKLWGNNGIIPLSGQCRISVINRSSGVPYCKSWHEGAPKPDPEGPHISRSGPGAAASRTESHRMLNLGHFQAGSYRYRTLLEGLYTL